MSLNSNLPQNPFNFYHRAGYNFFQILDHFLTRRVTIKLFGKIRFFHFKSMASALEKKGKGVLYEVDQREHLSISEFKNEYLKKGMPVIIKNGAKNWDCVKNWSPEYFQNLHGDDKISLFDGKNPSGGVQYTTLLKLIERIKQGDKTAYFRAYNLLHRHPEHYQDFDMEWLKKLSHKRKYFASFQVFIGPKNSETELHNSHLANLFIQVYGKKEWILYPNFNVPFIDPPSTLNGIYRNSPSRAKGQPFNPFHPDNDGYPYYKYLDGYRLVLEPGDILYNPPFMWHVVRNETDSIGVGYRWINAMHSFKASPVYYLLDLMAYRPNYFKTIKRVKVDGNNQFIDKYGEKKT